jgi:hypothetical protein
MKKKREKKILSLKKDQQIRHLLVDLNNPCEVHSKIGIFMNISAAVFKKILIALHDHLLLFVPLV